VKAIDPPDAAQIKPPYAAHGPKMQARAQLNRGLIFVTKRLLKIAFRP
jgi:hypothetical protein